MPRFEVMPLEEARAQSASGKRGQIIREYMEYINRLAPGQAGYLEPGPGETVAAVRRRLGAAAKDSGKPLTIRRVENRVYFWLESQPRRRGRKPKNAAA